MHVTRGQQVASEDHTGHDADPCDTGDDTQLCAETPTDRVDDEPTDRCVDESHVCRLARTAAEEIRAGLSYLQQ